MRIIQISSEYFCAGAISEGGKIIKAAPIIRYMIGWKRIKAKKYCFLKKWKWIEWKEEGRKKKGGNLYGNF